MIIAHINRADLVALSACKEGLELFDAIKAEQDSLRRRHGKAPRKTLRIECAPLAYVWASIEPGRFWAWCAEKNLLPRVNLGGANLRGANLRGANLRGANLRGANLSGADLYGADLYGANLRGADLYGADLHGANLIGANLYGADLGGANLYGANLHVANLIGANLSGADLYGANLGEWERGPDGYARRKA